MKAAVIPEVNGRWELREVPTPEPGPGEVLMRVRASGVCVNDVLATTGAIRFPSVNPAITGHEPAGEVVAVGPGVTTRRVGDRVGTHWVRAACGRCDYRRLGLPVTGQAAFACAAPTTTGFSVQGGHAVGHTVHLCALRGDDVVYLEKLHESGVQVVPTAVGMRLPAHCTGVGKALLAHRAADADAAVHTPLLRRLTPRSITEPRTLAFELAQVRQRGMATDRDEAVPGLSCVARPVLVGGRAVAAVSIGFPSSAGRGEAWLGPLGRTIGSLSAALRERPDLMEYLFRSQA